jgi:hypothetical protein
MTVHAVFEANFCRPYTGHDKGGVESRGKNIRLQSLVPILKRHLKTGQTTTLQNRP